MDNRVKVYSPDGKLIREIGSKGDGPGQFMFPVALAIGYSGEEKIYVADQDHMRIQVFNRQGDFIESFGEPLLNQDDWHGKFRKIQSMDIDWQARLHVVDSFMHRVQIMSCDAGRYIDSYGSFGTSEGQLNLPLDILVTGAGDVIAADAGAGRIKKMYSAQVSSISCAADNDCPVMYDCTGGACMVAEAVFDIVPETTTVPSEPQEPSGTTTIPGSDNGSEVNPDQCIFEYVLGPGMQSQLNTLRRFRDIRMVATPEYVRMYYAHSDEINEILSTRSRLLRRIHHLSSQCIPLICKGLRTDKSIQINEKQKKSAILLLKSIRVHASPALRKDITLIIKQLSAGSADFKALGIDLTGRKHQGS
jgi:hypothetical protein